MKLRSLLRPVQLRAIEEMKTATGLQLVMGMGGGKTVAFLTAVVDLLAAQTVRAAVVIAPVRVALTTWPNEISSWAHLRHLDVAVLAGSPEKRLKLLREKHDLYICSTDNLVWLIDALRKFTRDDPRWDMLCIDELSRFKSPRGERAKKLNRFADRFRAIIGLTGTPRPNSWEDQWMPLQIVSAGEAWDTVGLDNWRRKYCVQMDWQGFDWRVRDDALPYIRRVIDDWTLTVPPEDSTDVPFNSGSEYDVVVPLTPAQKADIVDLEKDLLIELGATGTEVLDGSDDVVVAYSQATATQKATQILQGFLYRDGEAVQVYTDAKLRALDDLLAAADGENVIIVYNYRYDLERLKKHLPAARWVNREQSDEDFVALIRACRRGDVQYLLAHPANLGHGIDGLQHGFARVIWYEASWSPELTIQMIRRIARAGQRKPVFSHRILADHWLERRRLQRVENKLAEEADFISNLRSL